jgi:hypothetical protein
MATRTPLTRILEFEAEYVHLGADAASRDEYADSMQQWYTGEALRDTDIDEDSGDMEPRRLYPIGVNYCKQIVRSLTGTILGEWDEEEPPRVFQPRINAPPIKGNGIDWKERTKRLRSQAGVTEDEDEESDDDTEEAEETKAKNPDWGNIRLRELAEDGEDLLSQVLFGDVRGNQIFSQLIEAAGISGTASLYMPYDTVTGQFKASVLPLQYVHYLWDDTGEIVEAAITRTKTAEEAMRMGWRPTREWSMNQGLMGIDRGNVQIWDYWTPFHYELWADDQILRRLPNPTVSLRGMAMMPGTIPLFPLRYNQDASEWYGTADIEPAIDLVKEINRIVADVGDNVNTTNVPLVYFLNCTPDGGSRTGGYLQQIGRNSVLMLHGDPAAKVGTVERPTLPNDTAKYIDILIQFLQDTALLPGPVLGRVKGTQTSAVALQTEMRPIIDVSRKHRISINETMVAAGNYVLNVAAGSNLQGNRNQVSGRIWNMNAMDASRLRSRVSFSFKRMLPRDAMAERDGIIAEMNNFLEEPVNAMRRLGRPDPEATMGIVADFWEWKTALNLNGQKIGQVAGQGQPGAPGKTTASPEKKQLASSQTARVPAKSKGSKNG